MKGNIMVGVVGMLRRYVDIYEYKIRNMHNRNSNNVFGSFKYEKTRRPYGKKTNNKNIKS